MSINNSEDANKYYQMINGLVDDYIDKNFTGMELEIPIHYINRSHGWSTTKLKKLIHDEYRKKMKLDD